MLHQEPTAMKTEVVHPELAAALNALKEAQGLSQARLARRAGLSRRHVSMALAGGNITIAVLKKLMHALGAETVPIGALGFDDLTGAGLVADQIERGIQALSALASTLRRHAKPPAMDLG